MRTTLRFLAAVLLASASPALAQATFRSIQIQSSPGETGINLVNAGAKICLAAGDCLSDQNGNLTLSATSFIADGGTLTIGGQPVSNGSAQGTVVGSWTNLTTAGDHLLSIQNSLSSSPSEVAFFNYQGIATVAGLNTAGNVKAGGFWQNNSSPLYLTGQVPDGASSVAAVIDNQNTFVTAGSKLLSVRDNVTEKFFVDLNGLPRVGNLATASLPTCNAAYAGVIAFDTTLNSLRTCNGTSWTDDNIVDTLDSFYVNAVASAVAIGYHKTTRAFLVTEIGVGVSVAAAGAGTTVLNITDGTNTCQATYNCATDTNTTGGKNNAPTVGAGSCTMLAGASLTVSIASSTCATTQPTLKNVWVAGQWQ